MMKELIAKIDEVQRLYHESDRLDEAGNEAEADKAYAEAYRLNEEVAKEISEFTRGQVDVEAASYMAWQQPEMVKSILSKAK